MLLLSNIGIVNFRSCINASFPLSDYTALVGYNNGGKTNILAGIKWLLKPTGLADTDFYDPSHEVIITGTFEGITDNVLNRLHERHRSRIEPYVDNGTLIIRRAQHNPGDSVSAILLEIRNPTISDETLEDAWRQNPTGINAAIKELFPEPIEIGAMENITEDVGKFKTSTTIGKLIAEIMGPLESQHGTSIRESMEEIRHRLEANGQNRAPELIEFDDGANENLRDLFPGIEVFLHLPAPEIDSIFKSGTIRVREEGTEAVRNISDMGHGAQRSIQMALIRYLDQIKSTDLESAPRTLLLIDEPELYLHPQAVEQTRRALSSLSRGHYQIIFATHSPQMVSTDEIPTALIIYKTLDEGTSARKRFSEAVAEVISGAPSQAQTLFNLGNASQILFSDKVLVCEGTAEERLLPDIFALETNNSLAILKLALVSSGGAGGIANCLNILSAMGIRGFGLVDLDYAFRFASHFGLIESDDQDIASCKEIFKKLAEDHGFQLAEDDCPQKGGSITSSEAFKLLGRDNDAIPHIENLHLKLREHQIWLWRFGDFEEHIGIQAKGELVWGKFRRDIRENSCAEVLKDYEGVRDFINWLVNN